MKKRIFKDMVSQTRLEYGFNGYRVPVFPRASRSARVRVPIRKTSGNNRKCAFEILVSVAGELLQESITSVPEDQQNANKNLVSKEQEDERQSLKCNISDQETCDEKTFIRYHQIDTLDKFSCAPDWFNSKAACANLKRFDQLAKVSGRNANPSEFSEGKVKDAGTESSIIQTIKSETHLLTGSLDVSQMDSKPPGFFCSDSKASMFKDWITLGPSRHSGTIESVNRDDDKNHTGCTQAATTWKTFRLPLNAADQRIKNLSSSRHWGVSPNSNGGASFRNDGRTSYSRRRSKRMSSFKRSDGDNSSADIRVGSSIASPHPHLGSRERNVKLLIKSFKVPELLVEIPTTATVGSLKRTVMEAVTTALGDGLHVGVLLQGKKIREDSKTLLQTGISRDGKHRSLGFMLEPGHPQIIPPPCLGEQRIARHVTSFTLEPGTSGVSGHVPPVSGCNNGVESDLQLVSSLPNISANTIDLLNSQSVLSIPTISVGAVAVVPTHLRARRREFVQRRIRRPFSVSEVEALVKAVEKLGTGRWRDVKLLAFDNAKHRTYVDLKDKWKTLVHTARISPQQRRGEPLPQELLDRVLAVHAYWSQQQAKQLLESGV